MVGQKVENGHRCAARICCSGADTLFEWSKSPMNGANNLSVKDEMVETTGHESVVDRVYHQIRGLIVSAGLKPGDQLPTESELVDLYGASRSTVRESLRLLEQEGTVHAVQGHGRFISASGALRVERPMTKYESITEVLTGLGYRVTSAVLEVTLGNANEEEAQALEIEPGAEVIRLLRIRYGDERPLVVSANTVPRLALPGPINHRDWSGSLTEALAAHGHYVNSALATISAVQLPEEWEQKYNLEGLGPWLLGTEVGLTRNNTRILYAKDFHLGSEITFSVVRRR
ncbi:GntR family transcriptional regulator [Paramicrobacterium chengjingii]|nr:GntR family transcriptional regulator [Microbacterium chengjingii]